MTLRRVLLALLLLPGVAAAGIIPAPTTTYWPSPEWNTFGDSIMSAPGGMQYEPAGSTQYAATVTSGSTSVTLAAPLAAPLQAGLSVWGTGIPASAYLTTAAPAGATTLTLSVAATAAGTAVNVQGIVSNSLQVGAQMNSVLGWLDALSGNAILWKAVHGYGGNNGALTGVLVINGGTGYAATSSWTLATGANFTYAGAGSMTCTATGGVIQACTPATPGGGYLAMPNTTCTAGCGSGAVFSAKIGGSGTFGSPGDTTSGMLQRVGDVCAAKPSWVLMDGGTNDLGQGASSPAALATAVTTAIANLQSITASLRQCGVRVGLFKVFARSTWAGVTGITAAQQQAELERLNRGIEQIGRAAYAANTAAPSVVVIDANRYLTDAGNSASPGYALAGMLADGLHPAITGAFWMGVATRDALRPFLPPAAQPTLFGQDDIYDATNNPSGNLLGTAGLMLGTGGSLGTSGCTGTVATGWTITRSGSTNTLTCAASIENPRTDALSGQRQVLTISATNSASTASVEYLRLYATVPAANINAGDWVEGSCEINLGSDVNVDRIGLDLLEIPSGGSGGGGSAQQHAYALDGAGRAGFVLPPYTKRAAMNHLGGGLLPDFTPGSSDGSFSLALRTMAPLQVQGASSSLYLYIDLGYEASATETGTQATLKAANCSVHKVPAP